MSERNILDSVMRQMEDDQRGQLFRAVVTGLNSNEVYIRRDDAEAADAQSYPKASDVAVVAGDEVLVARVGNSFVVLCKIIRNGSGDPAHVYHYALSTTAISGTGTPGVDNTAQTVQSVVIAANTLTEVGDRLRVRCYWRGDTGGAMTTSIKIGAAGSEVLVSHTTDSGAATMQINEAWLHYVDSTHANIIENEAGALGILSAANVAGFTWNAAQQAIITQDAVVNNHIVVFALIIDIFPKGV